MGIKRWQCEVRGNSIEVENGYSLFPPRTYERLCINGVEVARKTGGFLRANSYLAATVESEHHPLRIEAIIGNVGVSVYCHILSNGTLIAGDEHIDLSALYPEEVRAARDRGALRFITTRGVLPMGVPFGLLMTLVNAGAAESTARLIFGGITGGLLFGVTMGYYFWWSQGKQLESYQSDSAPSAPPEES